MKGLTKEEIAILAEDLLEATAIPTLTPEQRLIRQCPDCGRHVPPVTPPAPQRIGSHYLETYFMAPHLENKHASIDTTEEKAKQRFLARDVDDVFSINYLKTRDAEMEPFCRDALNYLKKHKLIYENYRDLSAASCLVRGKLRNDREGIIPSSSDDSSYEDSYAYDLDYEEQEEGEDNHGLDPTKTSDEPKIQSEEESSQDESSFDIFGSAKQQTSHHKYSKVKPGEFTHKTMSWMKNQLRNSKNEAQAKHLALKQAAREAKEAYEAAKADAKENPQAYLTGIQERVFKTLNKGQCMEPTLEQTKSVQHHKEGIRAVLNKLMSWGPVSDDGQADSIANQEIWKDVNEVFNDDTERSKINEKCDEGFGQFVEYHSLKSRVGCIYNKIPPNCEYHEIDDAPRKPPPSSNLFLQRMATMCTNLTTTTCKGVVKVKKPKLTDKPKDAQTKTVRDESCLSDDTTVAISEIREKKLLRKGPSGPSLAVEKTEVMTDSTEQPQINLVNRSKSLDRYLKGNQFNKKRRINPCKNPVRKHLKGLVSKILADQGGAQQCHFENLMQ